MSTFTVDDIGEFGFGIRLKQLRRSADGQLSYRQLEIKGASTNAESFRRQSLHYPQYNKELS